MQCVALRQTVVVHLISTSFCEPAQASSHPQTWLQTPQPNPGPEPSGVGRRAAPHPARKKRSLRRTPPRIPNLVACFIHQSRIRTTAHRAAAWFAVSVEIARQRSPCPAIRPSTADFVVPSTIHPVFMSFVVLSRRSLLTIGRRRLAGCHLQR
uniref:Uncharacterized protein n=1 Tax=Ixodes ricinus TaxID=34613 RepID=A0A6B0UVU6_IXORI